MKRALLVVPALLIAACGAASPSRAVIAETTTPPPPRPLLRADLVGGCFMMGPNCSRYVVSTDGTVEVYRLGDVEPELLWTSSIDPPLVGDLQAALAVTDLEALRSRLPAGTCHACVDGIDTVLTFHTTEGDVVFDSAQVELDAAEPVFAAASLVVEAAVATGEVPIISR